MGKLTHLLTKIKSSLSSGCSSTVHVTNESCSTLQIQILSASYLLDLTYSTTDELYHEVSELVRLRTLQTGRFYIVHNTKPLLRGRSLADYNIGNYSTLRVIFPLSLGGGSTILLPTYTVVQECERQVLLETSGKFRDVSRYELQADENIAASLSTVLSSVKAMEGVVGKDHSWMIEMVENFFQIIYWFRKCDSMQDYIVCTTLAHKLMTGKSISSRFFKIFGFESELQGEFTDFVKSLRDLYTTANGMFGKDSLLSKVQKAYTYLLTKGFFVHFGMELSEEEFLKLESSVRCEMKNDVSMVLNIFDVAITICERIDAYRLTGDLLALVHTDAVYAKWCRDADRLIGLAPFTSNLKPHGTTYFSFTADLNDAIERGQAINSYTRANCGREGSHFSRKLSSLQLLKNTEITRRASQKERKAPFGVLVHGGSSVAKSSFTKMLYYYYAQLHGLDSADHYRYVRNPADEYWSNFDSSKWCIQMDDIAFLLPSKSPEVDPTLKEMLNVVNNVPYVPPQASLEDKGKTPVMAELVIATSNAHDLNAQAYFHCPLAVRRRLPFVIKVQPKEQYTAANGKFIDPSLLPAIAGNFPDYWKITLQKIVPVEYQGRDSAILEDVQVFTDVEEFLKVFGKASVEHKNTQDRALTCDKGMRDIKVCKLCFGNASVCSCMQAFAYYWWYYLWGNFMYFLGALCTVFFCNTVLYWMGRFYLTRYFTMWMTRFTNADLERKAAIIFGECRLRKFKKGVSVLMMIGKVVATTYVLYKVGRKTMPEFIAPSRERWFPHEKKQQEIEPVEHESKREEAFCDDAETYEYTDELVVQGNVFGTVEEQLKKEERSNVWYNPQITLNKFDVPTPSKSLALMSPAELRDYFASNCVRLIFKGDTNGKEVQASGVFLRGQWLMLNRHILDMVDENDMHLTVVTMTRSQALNSNVTIPLKRSRFIEIPARDCALIELRALPPFKNILKYWATTSYPISKMLCVRREANGCVEYQELFGVNYTPDFPVCKLDREMPVYLASGHSETKPGDCGGIGILNSNAGPIICGMHTLGYGKYRGFVSITRDILEEKLKDKIIVDEGAPPDMSLNGSVRLDVPHHRSMFRYIQEGTARVYGTLSGARPKMRSRVCDTILQDRMVKHFGCAVEFDKPPMEGWKPWRLNVVQMIQPNYEVDEDILAHCAEAFTAEILEGLNEAHGEEWKKELIFLSRKAAINGLPGVKYIDRINISTSMGHPWHTTKKKYLTEDIDERYPDGVKFDEVTNQRMDNIAAAYKRGERYNPVFTGHGKDDPTHIDKIKKGKLRIFTAGPADWSVETRARLLTFVRLVQQNKFIFECAAGTVCQSKEWSDTYAFLTKFGLDRIVAGDYGKFDKRMISLFILASFDIICNIYRTAGFDDEELREIMCIGQDIAFPIVNMNGDLWQFYGTNPSGHPLTVIVNSLVNSLYVRYAYARANPESNTCWSFKKNVSLLTYGDDNAMGVSEQCSWFNHTVIQDELAKIGVEYTMADKESESRPYIHIDECSFLKRTWRWEPELEAYVCPLEMTSIFKSLTKWIPSDTIDAHKQMVAIISSANSEFFFHGKEMFEKHRAFFKSILEEYPYSIYVSEGTLPDWEALCERFRQASS